MYANDFKGEILINTESQVVEFIRNRPAFNAPFTRMFMAQK